VSEGFLDFHGHRTWYRFSGKPSSLVLSSTLASADQWVAEQQRLLEALGPGAGDDEYTAAHFCRLDPPPPEMEQWKAKRSVAVYEAMWGPNEWTVNGVLAGWDTTHRLGEIRVPTLVISGRYDACTPAIAETMAQGIPNAEHVLFEHSAQIPFVEEPERTARCWSTSSSESRPRPERGRARRRRRPRPRASLPSPARRSAR